MLRSLDFAEVRRHQESGDWAGAGDLLSRAARDCVAGGADVVAICTNLMHKVAPAVEAAVDVPLLHIGDAVAGAAADHGWDRLGVLGTRWVMEEPFYAERLARHGITAVTPGADDRALVDRVVFDELTQGVLRPESRAAYVEVVERLARAGRRGGGAGVHRDRPAGRSGRQPAAAHRLRRRPRPGAGRGGARRRASPPEPADGVITLRLWLDRQSDGFRRRARSVIAFTRRDPLQPPRSPPMIVLHATIAILAVVLLIIVLGVDPVISLVIGSLYLGLAGGLGFEGTITAIIDGFGAIMAEVGLLIGFGVLMGSLLFAMQALQRLVAAAAAGARRRAGCRTRWRAVMTSLFPSIYVDVQLVLAAPLARSAAPQLGRNGLGLMGGALTAGILVGYVFVVPGLGTISIAGLLDIPLATMLGYGLLIGPLTAVLTVFVYGLLLKRGFWDPEKDEHASESLLEEEALAEEQAEELADERRPRGAAAVRLAAAGAGPARR